jgi:hypothetical protein
MEPSGRNRWQPVANAAAPRAAQIRLAAAPASVLTIPLGTEIAGVAQVGALAAIVAGALALDRPRAHALAASVASAESRRRET